MDDLINVRGDWYHYDGKSLTPIDTKTKILMGLKDAWTGAKAIGKQLISPEFLKYMVPGMNTGAFALDAANEWESAKQSAKEGNYQHAIGHGLKTLGNIGFGASSLAPFVGSAEKDVTKLEKLKDVAKLAIKDNPQHLFQKSGAITPEQYLMLTGRPYVPRTAVNLSSILPDFGQASLAYGYVTSPEGLIKARASRLGMSPEEYVKDLNGIIVRSRAEALARARELGFSERELSELNFTVGLLPYSYTYAINDPSKGFIYTAGSDLRNTMPGAIKHLSSSDLRLAYENIIMHEGSHARQALLGLYNLLGFLQSLDEAGIAAPLEIFRMPSGINTMSAKVPGGTETFVTPYSYSTLKYLYNPNNGFTEAIARVGQIKDALGLMAGEDLTEDMVKYYARTFITRFPNNNIGEFLLSINDLSKFVKWANTPTIKKIIGMSASGYTVGKGINYLNLLNKTNKGEVR